MKMPDPMIPPITTIVASKGPSARRNVTAQSLSASPLHRSRRHDHVGWHRIINIIIYQHHLSTSSSRVVTSTRGRLRFSLVTSYAERAFDCQQFPPYARPRTVHGMGQEAPLSAIRSCRQQHPQLLD